MRLVGFNGRQVREGTCNRGKQKSHIDSDDEQNEQKPTKITSIAMDRGFIDGTLMCLRP